jgi:UDPglucose--hexose-1-phosphate uridylyltransferase
MTERRNVITGERILFAPERAERPNAFSDDQAPERCPFCEGHEIDTPEAVAIVGEPWRVRVVPNKYPPVPGAEVIVESPTHGKSFEDLAHAAEVVEVIVDRYRAHASAAHVAIFKNEGPRGGASIPHVHSQLLPLDFVPPRIAREAQGFQDARACPLCDAIGIHRERGLVIRETDSFVALAPSGSWMAWQQWIVPKEHEPEMSLLDRERCQELAVILRHSARALRALSPSYNWTFQNFRRSAGAHWYVDLFPRITTIAGFELSTGTFVEIIDPAATARKFQEMP